MNLIKNEHKLHYRAIQRVCNFIVMAVQTLWVALYTKKENFWISNEIPNQFIVKPAIEVVSEVRNNIPHSTCPDEIDF